MRRGERVPDGRETHTDVRISRGVLFLCVANSVRSQMAEGFARAAAPEGIRVHSAGSFPGSLHPLAVRVMAELGIDISGQHSKGADAVALDEVDLVVTLCQEEVCPPLPSGVRHLHWPCVDPMADATNEAELLDGFRQLREQVRRRVEPLFGGEAADRERL